VESFYDQTLPEGRGVRPQIENTKATQKRSARPMDLGYVERVDQGKGKRMVEITHVTKAERVSRDEAIDGHDSIS